METLMAIKHLGDAFFIDDRPIQPKRWREEMPHQHRKRWGTAVERAMDWFDQMAKKEGLSIHPYAEFPSLERADVGLALIEGGEKVLDHWAVKSDIMYGEPRAPYLPGDMIASELKDARWYYFEEYPYVEVRNKKDWELLNELHETARERHFAENKWEYKPGHNEYRGRGIYDARDMERQYKSAEEYEISDLEREADDLIDYMFTGGLMASDLHGEEWLEAFEKLAIRAAGEEEAAEEEEETE
jgi:hypothetical protein